MPSIGCLPGNAFSYYLGKDRPEPDPNQAKSSEQASSDSQLEAASTYYASLCLMLLQSHTGLVVDSVDLDIVIVLYSVPEMQAVTN